MIAPDLLLAEDALDQGAVGDGAFVEGHILGHRLAGAVGQIVDHRDRPAPVLEREDGMAADIAGAAGYEHWESRHGQVASEEAKAPLPAFRGLFRRAMTAISAALPSRAGRWGVAKW